MPINFFTKAGKQILIPILISDSIRKELAKRVEEVILAQAKLLSGGKLTEDVRLDPMDFKSETRPAVVPKKDQDIIIKTIYTIVDGTGLSNLLKADVEQQGSSKITKLFSTFRDMLYRRIISKLVTPQSKIDVIWKEEFTHVVFDKSDIEKAGLTMPINPKIIKQLQSKGWKNIVVYDSEEQKLHFYTIQFPWGQAEQI
jgi:hypothetical protein